MLRGSTVWEDYVKTVCTTSTTWAQTKGMVARIVGGYGAPHPTDDRRAFPTPEAITAATPDDFAATVRAGYRAPYLYATALAIAEGRLDLEQYRQCARELDGTVLMRELGALRGIGPYGAAHMALLLGSYSAIPSDSGPAIWCDTISMAVSLCRMRMFTVILRHSDAGKHLRFAAGTGTIHS